MGQGLQLGGWSSLQTGGPGEPGSVMTAHPLLLGAFSEVSSTSPWPELGHMATPPRTVRWAAACPHKGAVPRREGKGSLEQQLAVLGTAV